MNWAKERLISDFREGFGDRRAYNQAGYRLGDGVGAHYCRRRDDYGVAEVLGEVGGAEEQDEGGHEKNGVK